MSGEPEVIKWSVSLPSSGELVDALTITTDLPVAAVVGLLTRAVKRAQLVVDGDLPPVAEREVPRDDRVR